MVRSEEVHLIFKKREGLHTYTYMQTYAGTHIGPTHNKHIHSYIYMYSHIHIYNTYLNACIIYNIGLH